MPVRMSGYTHDTHLESYFLLLGWLQVNVVVNGCSTVCSSVTMRVNTTEKQAQSTNQANPGMLSEVEAPFPTMTPASSHPSAQDYNDA